MRPISTYLLLLLLLLLLLSFGKIAKVTGVKMTAKVVGKNSKFCFSVKNNLN